MQTPSYGVGATFVSKTGQFPCGKDSVRCWKCSRGNLAHVYSKASPSSCRFFIRIFMLRIIWKTSTSIKCSIGFAVNATPTKIWDEVQHARSIHVTMNAYFPRKQKVNTVKNTVKPLLLISSVDTWTDPHLDDITPKIHVSAISISRQKIRIYLSNIGLLHLQSSH